MSRPERLWHLEWHETFRDRDQERRYRNPAACARQVAAILAAPDDIARLKGLWLTAGWKDSRLGWERLDPHAFLAQAAEAQSDAPAQLDTEMTVMETYEALRDAWREHQEA